MEEKASHWTVVAIWIGIGVGVAASLVGLTWPLRGYYDDALIAVARTLVGFTLGMAAGIIVVFAAWIVYAFYVRIRGGSNGRHLQDSTRSNAENPAGDVH